VWTLLTVLSDIWAIGHTKRFYKGKTIGQHTRYLLVDTKQNSLVEVDVDLEELAQRIRVMEPWERIAPP
jgi:hypothetical protein